MLCEAWPAKFHCRCDRPHPFCWLTSEIFISKIFRSPKFPPFAGFSDLKGSLPFLAAAFGGVSSLAPSLAAVIFASSFASFCSFLAHYAQLVGEVLFVVVVNNGIYHSGDHGQIPWLFSNVLARLHVAGERMGLGILENLSHDFTGERKKRPQLSDLCMFFVVGACAARLSTEFVMSLHMFCCSSLYAHVKRMVKE